MSVPSFKRAIERRMLVIGILLIPISLYTFVSLLTYTESDFPNSSKISDTVINLGGLEGARIAYYLTIYLGYGGYTVPVIIWLLAWNRIRGKRLALLIKQLIWVLILMVIGISTGSQMPYVSDSIKFQISGLLGTYIGEQMASFCGQEMSFLVGSLLLLGVFVIIMYKVWKNEFRS